MSDFCFATFMTTEEPALGSSLNTLTPPWFSPIFICSMSEAVTFALYADPYTPPPIFFPNLLGVNLISDDTTLEILLASDILKFFIGRNVLGIL
ncbi:hypothetical protein AR158_C323R [Paramecium bursaria Chlorella virus AR158]|uniref:hypothetical protein n=1 Tax=Paramecium bursaria Chlorella virus AR158 TaxID=380598 RepID=UPI00015AA927|nr:hypothetical protein AR158_C323R [Paramecium bursaria Chlorella virus AR158]ABU43868.1 hypothetical protein AR158_C323R [Paramecium bursaria Chlorella virus AR158]